MKRNNPECIECGLLKSTTEALISPLCSKAKLAGGSHNFGLNWHNEKESVGVEFPSSKLEIPEKLEYRKLDDGGLMCASDWDMHEKINQIIDYLHGK